MTALYNEIDPFAAEWLRELIKRGHIAPGIVVTASIEDLTPNDIRGFTQVHFFAGIGVWSYALRRAGWPDDRPVWTGSCPCQPFSAAGKGGGFDDERHLWPAWFWLIDQCRPPVILGEQVASKDAEPWIDLVSDDLEAVGYGVGAVPFPSAGIGAPHIRDRLYWVADAERFGRERGRTGKAGGRQSFEPALGPRDAERLADAIGERGRSGQLGREDAADARLAGEIVGLADANGRQRDGITELRGLERDRPDAGRPESSGVAGARRDDGRPGPVNGLWRAADWLFCRDGKWRPVEPGAFPLAHGAPARVGRLRGYGNAINAEAARVWIEAYLEARTDAGRNDAVAALSLEEMLS